MKSTTYYYNKTRNPANVKMFRLGGKCFGSLSGDVFARSVSVSKHLYRALDGWGIDLWLLKELERSNCTLIKFIEKEEHKEYSISLADFKKNSSVIDHGFGIQAICPRKFWQAMQLDHQLSLME